MKSEIKQFKSLIELRDYIKQFDGFRARPVRDGEHPILYREDDTHNTNTHGIRHRDYLFDVDGFWVLPHDQKGLSFSGTWKHLSGVYKMFSRGANKTPDVYWVLSGADLPPGLKFEQDQSLSSKAKGHYFLTVTERMHVSQLRQKLLWVADRIQKIYIRRESAMTFKPYHYEYINEFLRYYASSLGYTDVIAILDKGITTEKEAKIFCDFIPILLDQRLADEKSGKKVPVEHGSAVIPDLHYEAGSFVCDAGFASVWDEMLDKL